MSRILLIESSTTVCSVAIHDENGVMAIREVNDGYGHAALLTAFIGEVLEEAACRPNQLSAVAVSKGPGSYTGLRIGVSAAKGICFAHNIPLIGIMAIEAMAHFAAKQYADNDFLIPMIDARRMEVYTAIYQGAMHEVEPLHARIIGLNSFDHLLESGNLILIGGGASKCRDLFEADERIIIRDDILPSASLLGELAEHRLMNGVFENLAYFEPLYLKEFIAGKPRVKGLF
jgi:tRNA threonylcarbamoyladenosine biosynthesis protein TsaB